MFPLSAGHEAEAVAEWADDEPVADLDAVADAVVLALTDEIGGAI